VHRTGTDGGPQTGHIPRQSRHWPESFALTCPGLADQGTEGLRDGMITVAGGVLGDHGARGLEWPIRPSANLRSLVAIGGRGKIPAQGRIP
jgi:hypothetical protein